MNPVFGEEGNAYPIGSDFHAFFATLMIELKVHFLREPLSVVSNDFQPWTLIRLSWALAALLSLSGTRAISP